MKRKKLFKAACVLLVLIIAFSTVHILSSENGKKPLYFLSRYTVSSIEIFSPGYGISEKVESKSAQISERDCTRLCAYLKEARLLKADISYDESRLLYSPYIEIYLKPFGKVKVCLNSEYVSVSDKIYTMDEKYSRLLSMLGSLIYQYVDYYDIVDVSPVQHP